MAGYDVYVTFVSDEDVQRHIESDRSFEVRGPDERPWTLITTRPATREIEVEAEGHCAHCGVWRGYRRTRTRVSGLEFVLFAPRAAESDGPAADSDVGVGGSSGD